jgi:lysozyme
MHETYLLAIKQFEGFTEKAKWDYSQATNGFGTRAAFIGEKITREEAECRFRAEIDQARAIVERHAPDVDEGTKAALTSLTFNAGDKWTRSGLGDAIRRNDLVTAREIFQQYNKAGGEVLSGLVTRRSIEAGWFGRSADGPTSSRFETTIGIDPAPEPIATQAPLPSAQAIEYRPPATQSNIVPNARTEILVLSEALRHQHFEEIILSALRQIVTARKRIDV